jgi:di/tripeptidase
MLMPEPCPLSSGILTGGDNDFFRHFLMADFAGRVKEFVTIDGTSFDRIVTCAVGSHRYKVTVRTEGGHSYGNFGNRNAIHVLSSMISLLYTVKVPQENGSKTTYNVGTISGGTSVNTIAQDACMMYEYRSDNKNCLAKMQKFFEQTVETFRSSGVIVEVEKVGDRPCSGDIDEADFAKLKNRISCAIKETFDMDSREAGSSTDANIPLSMGVPAVCISACNGAGCHTREESLVKASLLPGCRYILNILCS